MESLHEKGIDKSVVNQVHQEVSLEDERQKQQKITPDTTTTKSNSIDESKLQNVAESQSETIIESEIPTVQYKNLSEPTDSEYTLLKTNEIVFDSTPTAVKTEPAVAMLVNSKLVVTRPMPSEVEPKQTDVITDLKPNDGVFAQSTEFTRTLLQSEETPNLETASSLTRKTTPVHILQRVVAVKTMTTSVLIDQEPPQLGRKKTIKLINGTVQVQQDSEDQPTRTVSRENPVEEVLTNSAERVKTELIDIQLSTDSQETVKASGGVIRVVKDEGKIVLGTQNMQVEDDEEKADLAELNPIITVAELGKVLDYIKRLTLNIRLNEELGMENNLADGEQTASEIDIVVSNEILELIEAIVEDYYSSLEPQIKDEEVIKRQTITFSTYGENKKQLIIDARQLSQIRQFLIAFDLSLEESTQDEERRVLHELDQLGEIESLVQKIESQLKDSTSEFTMIVSQELLAFIEKGGKIIEETEGTNSGIPRSMSNKETKVKQFIAISSSDRKIKIDLMTLKKLMKLLKKKRRIESEQAPEEIKGNIKTFQSGNNISIWFIYQVIIFLLALVDNQRSDYNPKHSKVLYAPTKQEILMIAERQVQGT